MAAIKVLVFLFSVPSIFLLSQATDRILVNQTLKDGETIVSANGNFELGFFEIGSLKNRYVGISYKKISFQTIVWVANRDFPLNDSSGELTLYRNGTLCLIGSRNQIIWYSSSSSSSGSSKPGLTSPVAQILDTGNFVVRNADDDPNPENFIWQSFDYPGDTFLPGMKYGMDFLTGHNRFLTSWRSLDDPSTGNYTNELDPNGVPQFFLKRNSIDVFRAGPWNGLRYSGMPNLKPNTIYKYRFEFNDREAYYTYELMNSSVITRMQLNPNGELQRYTWVDRSDRWHLYLSAQMDNCDRYALCGSYGTCNINNNPACGCLKGFVPKSSDEWFAGDWSQGCVREKDLNCEVGEDFLKISGVKLPDTRKSWYDKSLDLTGCKRACLKNCSCTAYSSFDIRNGGTGCIIWFDNLIDIREYNENGQDIYIRLAASEIEAYKGADRKKKLGKILASVLSVGLFLLGLCIILVFLSKKKKKKREREETTQRGLEQVSSRKRDEEDLELPFFDLDEIVEATNDFSDSNKLGKGGFGPVYKGIFADGQEIAVKRLSRTSSQGLEEFKNEVRLIAKLQHRNLVKILGCCVQEDERILVYEYMVNRSLDSFIFDKVRRMELDWTKRINIINGIARGLVYLHQDSRLRIIHRDLKASNVLLDSDMNPKISDFGMARTFGGDETEANTTRVVGTYGYMSPEYQIDGFFSVKSDVFSFGVLVLEILTGKRNRGFCTPEHKLNLVGHAWRLYKEERTLELIEKQVKESCNEMSEALRLVHIGLLCVQQNPEDRPNMSKVVLMLSSDMVLEEPKEPGFFTERNLLLSDSASIHLEIPSHNVLTMTAVEPR